MFKISRMIDYGVVIMSQLAHTRHEIMTAPEIAEATGLPMPTVSKVLKVLGRSDIVQSHRGVNGGYALARPAHEITLADIIETLEGPVALTACVDASDQHCKVETFCPIKGGWEKVNHSIRRALEDVNLVELTAFPEYPDPKNSTTKPVKQAVDKNSTENLSGPQ
ncbi:MAG: SUF system Fe-S cluster assembly regulator [Alphaproteobacteria bacterium]|nr:SUF system Fe-S cluster assembly regulator [Alphaproteobacteria bacterium]